MQIHLKVTYEDIYDGVRGDSKYCPLARALKRVLIENGIPFEDIVVDDVALQVFRMGNVYVAQSFRTSKFVEDFDNCIKVFPFELNLEFGQV